LEGLRATSVVFAFSTTNACWPPRIAGVIGSLGGKFQTPVISSNGLTVGSELITPRTNAHPIHGTLTKAYAFMVGTSSDGGLNYNGPYKGSGTHYRYGRSTLEPQDFFGHTPVGKIKKC